MPVSPQSGRGPGDETPDPVETTELWRLEQLLAAGYPYEDAELVARREDIDLHHACDLLARGATVKQALSILL